MSYLMEIDNLGKRYDDFELSGVSLAVEPGCVVGFIGSNGAGKTTTIKAVLGIIAADAGTVRLFGQPVTCGSAEMDAIKSRIGIVLDTCAFPDTCRVCDVGAIGRAAYREWDAAQFAALCDRFSLAPKKKVSELSRGMGMKLTLAFALSHNPELLVLDEATAGLDPIARDEVLDLLYDFMQDETRAVLLSSHITSDLDKIADEITFIHKGEVLLSEPRDELLDTCGILRCTADQLDALDPSAVRAKRVGAFGCEALVRRDGVPANWSVEPVNIEQIMLFLTRGERAE